VAILVAIREIVVVDRVHMAIYAETAAYAIGVIVYLIRELSIREISSKSSIGLYLEIFIAALFWPMMVAFFVSYFLFRVISGQSRFRK
jgi:hypothetical protein